MSPSYSHPRIDHAGGAARALHCMMNADDTAGQPAGGRQQPDLRHDDADHAAGVREIPDFWKPIEDWAVD